MDGKAFLNIHTTLTFDTEFRFCNRYLIHKAPLFRFWFESKKSKKSKSN